MQGKSASTSFSVDFPTIPGDNKNNMWLEQLNGTTMTSLIPIESSSRQQGVNKVSTVMIQRLNVVSIYAFNLHAALVVRETGHF